MRTLFIATALSAVAAYYVYLPLPSTISEPWKLMVLDAILRGIMNMGYLAHNLGLTHHIHVVNYIALRFDMQSPQSSETVQVTDTSFAGVQARVFESVSRVKGQRLKRGVVYFHGGGWAFGSARMRSYDFLCRKMAEDLDAVIFSVDYRLAPEVHFPEQFNDALQASRHILQSELLAKYSVDPARVAVSGDSAGGNLAAAVAQQMALDPSVSVRFKAQALIYPVLQALDFNTPSYQQNGQVPILYRPLMARFWLEYLNGDQMLVASLLANNHIALDQGPAAIAARTKVNWTGLLPPAYRKHYEPLVPSEGGRRVAEELPALLDTRAAPLLSEGDVLGALPPTYIMTCEHDVLRDDGLMYGQRLEEAGVAVTSDYYPDGFHGCMIFAFWPFHFSVGARSVGNYIHWLEQNV